MLNFFLSEEESVKNRKKYDKKNLLVLRLVDFLKFIY